MLNIAIAGRGWWGMTSVQVALEAVFKLAEAGGAWMAVSLNH
jgi:hypothetical protein